MTLILVIEDELSLQEEITMILECLDFQVITAANGSLGVTLAETHRPDLILCDIMMPELDGYAVLIALGKNPATASIPLIYLTAKADRSDIRQGMNLGADDYITKPFSAEDLQTAITARLARQSTIVQPYLDEMKQTAQQIHHLAYTDLLTELPNQLAWQQHLQRVLASAQSQQSLVAIVCCNVLRFRTINMILGHLSGDIVLQTIAKRLRQLLSENQALSLIARLNNDEFGIILTHCQDYASIIHIAHSILKDLSQPYDLNGQAVQLHFSLGITVYPDDLSSPDELVSHAEIAMRWLRPQTSRYRLYQPDMQTCTLEQRSLELSLQYTLDRDEFELYYQPQVCLKTGRITGAEALLRWHHPQWGLVSPDNFIPIAEETGLIIPIGNWVLKTACDRLKQWQTRLSFPLSISVNVSVYQLNHPGLAQFIKQLLQETGLAPHRLELELTETGVMEHINESAVILQQLKDIGVRLAIDDFGIGYSSLNYLRRLPIDVLKIDRSFTMGIHTDVSSTSIIKAILALARSLNLDVVAEGVETPDQIAFFLQHPGCNILQGYFFSPPIPEQAMANLLAENRPLYDVGTL